MTKTELRNLRMLFQVAFRLDVLLAGNFILRHQSPIFLNVAPLLPIAEHATHISLTDTLMLAKKEIIATSLFVSIIFIPL